MQCAKNEASVESALTVGCPVFGMPVLRATGPQGGFLGWTAFVMRRLSGFCRCAMARALLRAALGLLMLTGSPLRMRNCKRAFYTLGRRETRSSPPRRRTAHGLPATIPMPQALRSQATTAPSTPLRARRITGPPSGNNLRCPARPTAPPRRAAPVPASRGSPRTCPPTPALPPRPNHRYFPAGPPAWRWGSPSCRRTKPRSAPRLIGVGKGLRRCLLLGGTKAPGAKTRAGPKGP